ncbi:diacylglycerol/lipid kinase family protein [Labedaea rhizosphaerae]|nr:diacylglycerol kinase family protein [Labedaea rhizosphaerae]
MRAVLVVNPRATATTPAGRDVLAHALASEVKLEVVETDYRGHALLAARAAAADGADLVVAHGGDGTVNEVVNGLLADGLRPDLPMLGVVPGGSANVFARALGLPRNPVDATHQLLRAIDERRSRRVGLGRVEPNVAVETGPRWFTFNAGVGLDADVVAGVDRKRGKRASQLLYLRVAVAEYLRPKHERPDLTVLVPGHEPVSGLKLAFVSNTDPWTYLGDRPVRLSPGTTFEGGLGLFGLRTLGLPTVARHLRQALSPSGKQKGRKLVGLEDVPLVVVRAEEPARLQVDGDLIGERTEVVFTSVPDALNVVV